MAELKIKINSYSDEYLPGWVKCSFTDIHGNIEEIEEKAPVVTAEDLSATSVYPQDGYLSCQILHKVDKIFTIELLGLDTVSGKAFFDVFEAQLIPYDDWRDFFSKKLTETGLFCLSQSSNKASTNIEVFTTLKGNPKTKIEVGYFSGRTLMYVNILNPETPGKNRQQELEYFYKYEFDKEKQYGGPGLDFTEINIQGISSYLEQGFNGHETVYYRNGKQIKSTLTSSYYPDSPKVTYTYNFIDEPFFKKLLNKIFRTEDKYDEIRHIDLQNIFSGLPPSA